MGKMTQISNLGVSITQVKKTWALTEKKQWKLAHTKTGEPILDEKVDLANSIQAKYLKLEINDYQAGTMGWRNVGIQEIRASNVPDHSR